MKFGIYRYDPEIAFDSITEGRRDGEASAVTEVPWSLPQLHAPVCRFGIYYDTTRIVNPTRTVPLPIASGVFEDRLLPRPQRKAQSERASRGPTPRPRDEGLVAAFLSPTALQGLASGAARASRPINCKRGGGFIAQSLPPLSPGI